MSDLIDTTQMYLRTIYELIEEGVPPKRARIAERLHQAGPTVSQTVARMERDGLLRVTDDRLIELSPEGLATAKRVMRKHRISERFLVDVLGLEVGEVHDEACKMEHVISARVERGMIGLVADPTLSPFGNPIPALDELDGPTDAPDFLDGADSLIDVVSSIPRLFEVRRISEAAQATSGFLDDLAEAGISVESQIQASRAGRDIVHVQGPNGKGVALASDLAGLVFVGAV